MEDFRDRRLELAHLGQQILAQRKEQAERQRFMREQLPQRFEEARPRLFAEQRKELFKLIEKEDDRLLGPSPFGATEQPDERRGIAFAERRK